MLIRMTRTTRVIEDRSEMAVKINTFPYPFILFLMHFHFANRLSNSELSVPSWSLMVIIFPVDFYIECNSPLCLLDKWNHFYFVPILVLLFKTDHKGTRQQSPGVSTANGCLLRFHLFHTYMNTLANVRCGTHRQMHTHTPLRLSSSS